MKKHHKKASGGEANFGQPRDDEAEEKNSKPQRYDNAPKIEDAAEEKKKGGRAKRRRGGHVKIHKHHEHGEPMKHAKHIGAVHGESHVHAGRAPRKAGGRTGSNFSPLSSAHGGTPPRDHKVTEID